MLEYLVCQSLSIIHSYLHVGMMYQILSLSVLFMSIGDYRWPAVVAVSMYSIMIYGSLWLHCHLTRLINGRCQAKGG